MVDKDNVEELKHIIRFERLTRVGLFNNEQFFDIPDKTIQNDLKLFRTILDRALIDYFHEKDHIREDVENWLDMENKDFYDICMNAYLDPEMVYRTFLLVDEILKKRKEEGLE